MRADQLIALVMTLHIHGKRSAQALADTLGVNRRTILRDVAALSTGGVPVITEAGRDGGIWLDAHYRVALDGLHADEVRALLLPTNTALLADIGLAEAEGRARLKLLAGLPSLHQAAASGVAQHYYIDPTAWWRGSWAPNVIAVQRALDASCTSR